MRMMRRAPSTAAAARGERLDLDPLAALRRVDHLPVPDVEADVPEAVEEDEVARLQVRGSTGVP